MAFADSGLNKVIVQGWFPTKVTLARDCKVGDLLGVAEDSLDDLGPCNANDDGHATGGVTHLPRLVAGMQGKTGEIITAYGMAVVQGTGLTGGFASEVMAKVRMLEGDELKPGEVTWAQLLLDKPIAVSNGDRFIIRSPMDTLGGGDIVDSHAKRLRRLRPDIIQNLVDF